jgi:hypothetical protein
MIPVMIPVRSPGLGGGHPSDPDSPGRAYVMRFAAIAGVLALLGVALLVAWGGMPRSRRLPSTFLESFAPQPILAGTLARIGAAPDYEVSSTEGTTLWWKRRFQERSFLITTTLTGSQVTPFLTAVRDSIEQRLRAHGATRRGLHTIAWPDSGSLAEPRGPVLVSMPYATRRRVGWVSLQATRVENGRLTMGLLIHEGPKASD